MATLKDLGATLKKLSKQTKFAQAQAMTKVVREVEKQEREHLEAAFDNPTPFTLKSIKSVGARREHLEAKVFIQQIAEQYLEPFQYGGAHKLNGRALLNPKEIRLNKYGNIARTRTKTLLARDDVFSGAIQTSKGEVRGIWQRKKKRSSAKKRKSASTKQKGDLKLLIRFGDAMPVTQRMDFYGVAEETINRALPAAMQEAIQKAFETAR